MKYNFISTVKLNLEEKVTLAADVLSVKSDLSARPLPIQAR